MIIEKVYYAYVYRSKPGDEKIGEVADLKFGNHKKTEIGARRRRALRKPQGNTPTGHPPLKYGLDFDAPEAGVRLIESDAHLPSFVTAPHDLAAGAAAGFGKDKLDLTAQGHVGANHGHAAGVADIHGETVGGAARFAFIPLQAQPQAGRRALVGAHAGPALGKLLVVFRQCIRSKSGHGRPHGE